MTGMLLAYILTSILFLAFQYFGDKTVKDHERNMWLGFLLPWLGYPRYKFNKSKAPNNRIIYSSVALIHSVFTVLFALIHGYTSFQELKAEKKITLQGPAPGEGHDHPLGDYAEVGMNAVVGAADVALTSVGIFLEVFGIFVLGFFATIIPLMISLFIKE